MPSNVKHICIFIVPIFEVRPLWQIFMTTFVAQRTMPSVLDPAGDCYKKPAELEANPEIGGIGVSHWPTELRYHN